MCLVEGDTSIQHQMHRRLRLADDRSRQQGSAAHRAGLEAVPVQTRTFGCAVEPRTSEKRGHIEIAGAVAERQAIAAHQRFCGTSTRITTQNGVQVKPASHVSRLRTIASIRFDDSRNARPVVESAATPAAKLNPDEFVFAGSVSSSVLLTGSITWPVVA
jgi:hypothetical protein